MSSITNETLLVFPCQSSRCQCTISQEQPSQPCTEQGQSSNAKQEYEYQRQRIFLHLDRFTYNHHSDIPIAGRVWYCLRITIDLPNLSPCINSIVCQTCLQGLLSHCIAKKSS